MYITLSLLDNQLYHSSWILKLSVCNLKLEQCNLRTWSTNYLLFACTVKLFKMCDDNAWSEPSRCQENSCKATVQTACPLLIFASLVSYTSKVNITDRHAEYVSVCYDEYCFFIYVYESMILFALNIRLCILQLVYWYNVMWTIPLLPKFKPPCPFSVPFRKGPTLHLPSTAGWVCPETGSPSPNHCAKIVLCLPFLSFTSSSIITLRVIMC